MVVNANELRNLFGWKEPEVRLISAAPRREADYVVEILSFGVLAGRSCGAS